MAPSTVDRGRQWLERNSRRSVKELRQRLGGRDGAPSLMLIVGCQRSGTTMMSRVFDADPDSRIFDEMSKLSSDDRVENLRFNDLDEVSAMMTAGAASLVVAKPLVESHRVPDLLDRLPQSRAIWMYRHHHDVVSSNLKRWGDGNGFDDLAPIVAGDADNWRSVDLAPEARALIVDKANGELSPADAAALFWWSRNTHYFRQNLVEDPRVLLYRYENVVNDPATAFAEMYRFAGRDFPGSSILSDISDRSVGKGAGVELSPDVEELCQAMLDRLDAAVDAQAARAADGSEG
jgi:hypothetical protein